MTQVTEKSTNVRTPPEHIRPLRVNDIWDR